jgi:hypothetical protein
MLLAMALSSPDSKPRIEAILQVPGSGRDAGSSACTGTSPILFDPAPMGGVWVQQQHTRATSHRVAHCPLS